jgi:Domain of unknown function (DUF2382)
MVRCECLTIEDGGNRNRRHGPILRNPQQRCQLTSFTRAALMSKPTSPQNRQQSGSDKVPVLAQTRINDPRAESEEILPLVEEIAQANLQSDSVEVNRVPIDRIVDVGPTVRTENDVVIVPVLEDVLVVQKQLVLKEELQSGGLRKQRAIVERVAPDGPNSNEEEKDR